MKNIVRPAQPVCSRRMTGLELVYRSRVDSECSGPAQPVCSRRTTGLELVYHSRVDSECSGGWKPPLHNVMTLRLRIAALFVTAICIGTCLSGTRAFAQSVCLPAPRLLTTMPMGGTVGSQVEITITGENIDEIEELVFSDRRIFARQKRNAAGQVEPNQYVVTIPAEIPTGLYEARLTTRLGISSSRAFTVGTLPEVTRTKPNTSLANSMELTLNSICNAVMTPRAVDHYIFEGRKGQRIVVDCASRGIDSKLDAVLIVANAAGNDLKVERTSGVLDFTVPDDGKYVIKVHELTYGGGPAYFYRLALLELPPGNPIVRQPSTKKVSSFSWPPLGLSDQVETAEIEPNNNGTQVQKISLPCDIAGSFFPAADVDMFEFEAKKGEVWSVEIASERLGLPTDPAALVQHVSVVDGKEKLTDVAEFSDIPSPVKVSSNGYAYDGPPFDAGSADFLAKLEIKEDGIHRLQLTDLFGATRKDPRNVYRLVIRKAAPDFAVVAWALHMELRNGDRNALSKPIALRGGSTMALEVVAVRRDGFDGEIELTMDDLPNGVTAKGLKIPAGKSRGIMLITAHQNAERELASAKFTGRADINGTSVTHPCRLASMAWPIPDAWNEIPKTRLLADVPVSVSGFDFAPISIAPAGTNVFEVVAGEKLTIPLVQVRRSEFSGTAMQLRTFGAGFEQTPQFEMPLNVETSNAVLDTAALKTPPGDYVIGFYGSAVAKYRRNLHAVTAAEEAKKKAEEEKGLLDAEVKKLSDEAKAASVETKAEVDKTIEAVTAKQKVAEAALAGETERLNKAIEVAKPVDLVDIVVSEPMTIRVKPMENK